MAQGDPAGVGRRYLEHLGEDDLAALAAAAGEPGPPATLAAQAAQAQQLRSQPGRILALLERPATYDALLAARTGGRPGGERIAVVSPFLVFAAAVHRGAAEVGRTGRVPEWTAPRQRLPLFVSPESRAFLADPARRLFLAELLASFATVASGSYLARTPHGTRRRRWSELDPVRLAGLLEALPPAEHAGVYRRLGDVALFLTGVFPDSVGTRGLGLGPGDAERLLRTAAAAGGGERRSPSPPGPAGSSGAVALLEHLGGLWYRRAVATALASTAATRELEAVADRFADARRLLTLVADRFLFAGQDPLPGLDGLAR